MKTIHLRLFIVLFLSILGSCCIKDYCDNVKEITEIYFEGFEKKEIDTLFICIYEKNGGLSTPTDSFYIFDDNSAPFYIKSLAIHRIDIQNDLKVQLGKGGEAFFLTDFILERQVCNECIFGNDYFKQLASYKLNNLKQSGNRITIKRQ